MRTVFGVSSGLLSGSVSFGVVEGGGESGGGGGESGEGEGASFIIKGRIVNVASFVNVSGIFFLQVGKEKKCHIFTTHRGCHL